MKLTISGRVTGAGVNQALIREASGYYHNLLMPSKGFVIDVEVRLIPNLYDDYEANAFTGWMDKPVQPRKFLIEMDSKLPHKSALITIAHEMVHVTQLALGRRVDSEDGKTIRWNGELISIEDTHYYDLPWEIDAYGREYGLYDRFVESKSIIAPIPLKVVK